jgi:hypothetical protein
MPLISAPQPLLRVMRSRLMPWPPAAETLYSLMMALRGAPASARMSKSACTVAPLSWMSNLRCPGVDQM